MTRKKQDPRLILHEYIVQNKQLIEDNRRHYAEIRKAVGHFNQDEHQEGMGVLQRLLGSDYMIAKVAFKEWKARNIGGYEYVNCPECQTEIETNHPVQLDMPYCSDCKMIVLDANQKYCCWCGVEFKG